MNLVPGRRMAVNLLVLTVACATLVACSQSAAAESGTPPSQSNPSPTSPGNDRGSEPGGGGGGSDPGGPIGVRPPPDNGGQPGQPDDGALHVRIQPGVINAIPHAWDRITVAADGRTITVYYWGGVEACYGLAAVEVERNADGLLVVRVLEGQRGDLPPDTACIELALLKAVTVELEEPIFVPSA